MHEISIIQNIIDIAQESALTQGATSIHLIALRVGAMSGVVPEALDFAFETVKKNTLANNASLEVEYVNMVCFCSGCKNDFKTEDSFGIALCPSCGEPSAQIVQGNELDIKYIEVSDE